MPCEYSKATALAIRDELRAVKKEYGSCNKANIVEWARRHSASRLYREFTWDVKEAARRCWLMQAGEIMRRLKVYFVVADEKGEQRREPVRVFVSVLNKENQREFEETEVVYARKASRESVLEEFRRDLEAFDRRYRRYDFLASNLRVLRAALAGLEDGLEPEAAAA